MTTKEISKIIKAYNDGQSMNSIAEENFTYTTTIKRILEKNGVKLRHDSRKEGKLCVKDGEKLIEWAKAQGRLVTKAELAEVIGRKRLSPSYFIKYPELGQYIETRKQKDIEEYTQKLYDWLKKNDIPYIPNDRTKLKVSVTALLLGKYEGLAIQILEKPKCVSKKTHNERMKSKYDKAEKAGIRIVFLNKDHFKNLNAVKTILDDYIRLRRK